MATDAYIKFGEEFHIEGDSYDETHYFWCELRDCDLELEASEREAGSEGQEDEHARTKIKKVTVKKRVDWASTELFRRCCMSWQVKNRKTDDDELGVIDQVTVEICRQSGEAGVADGETYPIITIRYYNVRVVNYAIEMSGPEPTETVTLELDEVGGRADVEYQQSDPFTGLRKDRGLRRAIGLTNSQPAAAGSAAVGAAAAASAAASAASAAGGVTVSAIPTGSGQSPAVASQTDASLSANYPGLWNSNGFGVLPD